MHLAMDLREERYSMFLENPIIMDPENDKIPTERFCGITHVDYTVKSKLYVQGRNGNENDVTWMDSTESKNAYILFSNYDKSPLPSEWLPMKFDTQRRFTKGGSDILSSPNPSIDAFEEFFHVKYYHGTNERLSIYWPASISRYVMP